MRYKSFSDFYSFLSCVGLGATNATIYSNQGEEDDEADDARKEGYGLDPHRVAHVTRMHIEIV